LGTLRGYDNTQAATGIKAFDTTIAQRVSGTDAILVIKTGPDEKAIASHDSGGKLFTLTAGSKFQENDLAFACDSLSSAIFQIYDISPKSGSNTGKNLDHRADSTNMNCGDFLSYASPVTTCPSIVKTFQISAETPEIKVAPLASSFWYVGNSGIGKRSLYRSQITRSGTGGTTIIMSADEIIPDVQDLQVSYLTRDGVTGTLATDWVAATSITDWSDNNPTAQVVAARLDLTLQTVDSVSTTQAPIQRHLIHVVGLRNRDVFVEPTPP
jgi:type IV pilus assembly protein PilW